MWKGCTWVLYGIYQTSEANVAGGMSVLLVRDSKIALEDYEGVFVPD